MEQQIRFCTAADDVRIAYTAIGHGYPLVRTLGWFTHLEYEWESPLWRHIIEGLARDFTFIRYDGRGTGLSDRKVESHSLEQWVADLEAVVDDAGLERFALLGISHGGSTAVAYAVRHPERVSHLILYGSFAKWPYPVDTERGRAIHESILTLTRAGWGANNPSFRQIFTAAFVPGATAEQMRWFDELQRNSCSAENAAAIFDSFPGIDVRELLPKVQTPTLVLHRRGDAVAPFEAGRYLASSIPGARFIPLEGNNHVYLQDEEGVESFFGAIRDFVGVSARPRPSPATRGMLTILFSDVEGSTALTQRLGDAGAREVLREHERIVREALRAHGGSEVKALGDGFMASFGSASQALKCAVAMQHAFAEHNETASEPIRVRIGLNAGEPIAEQEDLFGTAVNLAARIAAQAAGGEILVANVVRELAAGKGFLFADRGEVALRGFDDPVRLYEVRWES